MSYVVSLEAFHGPLDLLLFLIDKDQVDIYDIPIARISDQFLDYIQKAGQYDLEIIGEFLVMATYLLQLKSRLLLPTYEQHAPEEDETEAADPRFELTEKLVAYKKIKAAADFLAEKSTGALNRVFYREAFFQGETVVERITNLEELLKAYQKLQKTWRDTDAELILSRQDIDIEEKTAEIMSCLIKNHNRIALHQLFVNFISKREALVMFLALLELIRQQKVKAFQERVFGDIIIYI